MSDDPVVEPIPFAFVAGIIDARAHIDLNDRHGKPQPRLAVTTKRVELLDYLAKLTGTTVRIDGRGYDRRPCGEHCREHHSHAVRQSAYRRVDSSRATIVLYNVRPFIVAQSVEVGRALAIGLESYPAARGNTAAQMAALGWKLPEVPGVGSPEREN